MRLHDTLSGQARTVAPSAPEDGGAPELKLYVCGITPYDSGHMGHAFTFCAFDVLVRHLEARGVRVRYVQNVTDVDDPLFERARRDGVDWEQLADREVRSFLEDMAALGWRPPDAMPRVSEEIRGIRAAAERLLAQGFAYRTDATYFEVSRYASYGALSHRTRRSMIAKLRDEGLLGRVGDGGKRDALDFPLWRPSGPGEPVWPSDRLGPGRPGWHLECSVMSRRHLGEQIDVHGGGRDLAFSHHESERAQSETLTGRAPFAGIWMHTGMVRYEGRKMSKSLGNLVVVRAALERVPAAAVRLYLASHRYRTDWSFEWGGLEAAARLARRARALVGEAARGEGRALVGADGELCDRFAAALDDDLDTPAAVRVLASAVRAGRSDAAAWMLGILVGEAALS